ncbi:hypothetical protein BaRGS_00002371, partial [Batillaria attramentaria]
MLLASVRCSLELTVSVVLAKLSLLWLNVYRLAVTVGMAKRLTFFLLSTPLIFFHPCTGACPVAMETMVDPGTDPRGGKFQNGEQGSSDGQQYPNKAGMTYEHTHLDYDNTSRYVVLHPVSKCSVTRPIKLSSAQPPALYRIIEHHRW